MSGGSVDSGWQAGLPQQTAVAPVLGAVARNLAAASRPPRAGGAVPEAADAAGWTPLHFAAQAQVPSAIEALLAAGASVDALDGHGNTPLWRAVFCSQGEGPAIRLLLEAGADPDRVNAHGVSPRALAGRIANHDVAAHFPGGAGASS
ncbi:ankyrin repeat domain-containing protein [Streptomyces sp. NPDC048370]|uniref:ankyrin repeat domain-containing protein n=1 Tax=Streptomyces sp. NPDC048370 TaxID=3365540 RepID=UPI0037213470